MSKRVDRLTIIMNLVHCDNCFSHAIYVFHEERDCKAEKIRSVVECRHVLCRRCFEYIKIIIYNLSYSWN